MQAFRLNDGESIALDGRLDEPVWSRTVPAGDFMQIDPDNGMPATEKTEVRIAFDADTLYIGITCYDSDPHGAIAYQRRRDEGLPSDDKIQLTIDTFLDGRTGYLFEMNPSGLMADALMGLNGDNREWDGIWNARARRSEIGAASPRPPVVTLTEDQFLWLLEGLDLKQLKPHRALEYRSVL